MPTRSRKLLRGPLPWIALLAIGAWIVVGIVGGGDDPQELTWTEFLELARSDALAGGADDPIEIGLRSNLITGEYVDPETGDATAFEVAYSNLINDDQLAQLQDDGLIAVVNDPEPTSPWFSLLLNLLPFVLILGLFVFLMNQMQGGGGRIMQFGRSRAKPVSKDAPKVTFDDVAGADEAVEELREIKEFLETPQKFQAMGAKIPKGVLLYGPPGTGKTLLARAVAGEAGVPFFSISGSDFVEMFVGVGASRVRDLFEQAKTNAPAIIFMDEIDAVGRHRGAGMGGGHDEREQTLNQLLVEMDGFDVRTAVILIAATNRPDILDPALLRPGRFDRQVVVDRPDLRGREAVLELHASGKPLDEQIDLAALARQTPGFTGADLANLVNEAALLAARRDLARIGMGELNEAIDRVIAGPERKNKLMSERERSITAYHEAGHAIVGHALAHADPIHKITIIPRGRAGGYTLALPVEDKSYNTRQELTDKLAMMLGGRVAEEIKLGDFTTGAANDIQKATGLAREMVTQYGMSDRLGPIMLGQKDGQPFLGRDYGTTQDYGHRLAEQIDDEVRRMLDEAHDEALAILAFNDDVLERMAAQLLELETLEGEALAEVLSGVRARPSRATSAPTGDAPDDVVEQLRRLGLSGRDEPHRPDAPPPASNGVHAAGTANGHADATPTTGEEAGAAPTGRTGRRAGRRSRTWRGGQRDG